MVLSLNNLLQSWSWKEIQDVYKIYGSQLKEYEAIYKRMGVPRHVDINLPDGDNVFILRFWSDIKKLDLYLGLLDQEIARRNSLVGVMG